MATSDEEIRAALVTYDEIGEAMRSGCETPREIVTHALANRFVPGEFYRDAYGRTFMRLDDADWSWLEVKRTENAPHGNWESRVVFHTVPHPPIYKLVSEQPDE